MKYVVILFLIIFLVGCDSPENAQLTRASLTQQDNQDLSVSHQSESQSTTQEIVRPASSTENAGELFGEPISLGNYYFVWQTVIRFGTPWGGVPSTVEQLQKRIEDDLLLSFEAFRQGITVTQEETDEEITKTLGGQRVEFDWKADKAAYEEWAQETLKEPVELFENQMRHLVQLRKLYQNVLDGIDPTVTEDEAFQEFLNEYNTLSVELVQFNDLEGAAAFYQKAVADSKFWEQMAEEDKKKAHGESSFRRPGFVSLEFLMAMWQFPKEAVYEMLALEPGAVYPPAPIYKGFGVFKVLEVRRANETDFGQRREPYYDQIRAQKKYEGFKQWLQNLHDAADMKIVVKLHEDSSGPKDGAAEGAQ